MADLKQTGYQAAATSVIWTSGQDLDSLTNNEWTDESDEIDNTSDLHTEVDLELVLGSAAFTGTDSTVDVFVIPNVDGTNYPDWAGNVTSDEQENQPYFVGRFTTSGATAAQRLALRDVRIPPGLYKFGLRNRANVTMAASGNTLKWRPHSFKSV